MTTFATFFRKSKTTAKFIWRHFFTICVIGMVISVFIQAPVNWKVAFTYFCIAPLIDWAKMRIKLSSNPCYNSYSAADFYQDHRRRSEQYEKNNPCVLYSPSYNLSHLGQRY